MDIRHSLWKFRHVWLFNHVTKPIWWPIKHWFDRNEIKLLWLAIIVLAIHGA